MQWTKKKEELGSRIPIWSWCKDIEESALSQAVNASNLPCAFNHVALMADAHFGYSVPIGSVLAIKDAVIPAAVGVDIGCGMAAIQTDILIDRMTRKVCDHIVNIAHRRIPTGEGHAHKEPQDWFEFIAFLEQFNGKYPAWVDDHGWLLDQMNLGTLGSGK